MIGNEEVERLMQDIWSTILSDESLMPIAPSPELLAHGRAVLACVSITGTTNATVQVACTAGLAGRVAQSMFQLGAGEVTDAEIRDALGEIANMTAGNIKAVVPGPSQLGLPVVCEGNDVVARVPSSHVAVEVALAWQADPIVVKLLVADEPPTPPSRVAPLSSPWSRR